MEARPFRCGTTGVTHDGCCGLSKQHPRRRGELSVYRLTSERCYSINVGAVDVITWNATSECVARCNGADVMERYGRCVTGIAVVTHNTVSANDSKRQEAVSDDPTANDLAKAKNGALQWQTAVYSFRRHSRSVASHGGQSRPGVAMLSNTNTRLTWTGAQNAMRTLRLLTSSDLENNENADNDDTAYIYRAGVGVVLQNGCYNTERTHIRQQSRRPNSEPPTFI